MNHLLKIISAIDITLHKILNLLLVFLVLDVSWQVTTRFVMTEPSSYTEEIARFLLVWIGLLGAAHAYRHKMHLGIDYFIKKINSDYSCYVTIFVYLLCAFFSISVFIIGGSNLTLLTLELNQISPALGIKMGYVYTVLPLTGSLIVLYSGELIFTALVSPKTINNQPSEDFLN